MFGWLFGKAKDVRGDLEKAGKLELNVQLTNAPDDEGFAASPPSCTVTVIAKFPNDPKDVGDTRSSELTARTPITLEVRVQELPGVLARWFGEPNTLRTLTVNTKPLPGWEDKYEESTRTITLKPGKSSIVVSMKPKITRIAIGGKKPYSPSHSDSG